MWILLIWCYHISMRLINEAVFRSLLLFISSCSFLLFHSLPNQTSLCHCCHYCWQKIVLISLVPSVLLDWTLLHQPCHTVVKRSVLTILLFPLPHLSLHSAYVWWPLGHGLRLAILPTDNSWIAGPAS